MKRHNIFDITIFVLSSNLFVKVWANRISANLFEEEYDKHTPPPSVNPGLYPCTLVIAVYFLANYGRSGRNYPVNILLQLK